MGIRARALEDLVVTPEFWKGKKVLVTGHTGFKGSWLSLWLKKLGADVTGFSSGMPSDPCLFTAADVGDGVRTVTADVRDLGALQECINSTAADIVIHLAAQSLVRESYADPIETYSTNVMGTVNLLEALRHSDSARATLIVTSDKCYENREWLWGYRENEPLGGHDPYSSSKACAELVTAAYRASFPGSTGSGQHGNAIASVRAGNVIGGGDWSNDRIVPDVLTAFSENRAASIRNPAAVRPWQFVLEPLHGYLLLAEKLWTADAEFASAWNFGPDDHSTQSVADIVGQMAEAWGKDATWEATGETGAHEAGQLRIDSSKANTMLGWAPVLPLRTTIDWIVEWYREALQNGNASQVTRRQLDRYHERVCT